MEITKIQADALVITEVKGSDLFISIGGVPVGRFMVSNRFQSNGHRRPKNIAVYIMLYGQYGFHSTVGDAVKKLEEMSLDTSQFIELLSLQGWAGDLPPKGQGSFL
jgi:hypothetical protein